MANDGAGTGLIVGFGSLLTGTILLVAGVKGSSLAGVVRGSPDTMRAAAPGNTPGGGTAAPAAAPSSPGQAKPQVAAAAAKYHVPLGILWGVYGMESSYGADLSTSSAGAQGPFQFLPSTGASYGLNASNIQQLGPSADAAAHYLSDLFHRTGSWDSALHAYSGGGYGLPAVQSKAQGLPTS